MTRARIPTVALATLVFGGACGDDKEHEAKGGSSSDVDVSDARIAELSKQLCTTLLRCEGPDEDLGSQAECERSYVDYFEEYSKLTDDCFDALLDYYECYAQLECSEFESEDDDGVAPCDPDHVDDVCGDQLDELEDEDDYTDAGQE